MMKDKDDINEDEFFIEEKGDEEENNKVDTALREEYVKVYLFSLNNRICIMRRQEISIQKYNLQSLQFTKGILNVLQLLSGVQVNSISFHVQRMGASSNGILKQKLNNF